MVGPLAPKCHFLKGLLLSFIVTRQTVASGVKIAYLYVIPGGCDFDYGKQAFHCVGPDGKV